jgi:hypothetical protein
MITFRHPGTVLTDRFFAVPLDHQRPDGEQIEVFAREVVAAARPRRPALAAVPAGRPRVRRAAARGQEFLANRALEDYRVLLLDQRGTGRSSPANRKTLARLAAAGPQAQAAT